MAQVKKPEVEQRLLEAALQTFAQRGYREAGMADIAQRAGLSTGNVYRYFANKDELFNAAVREEDALRFLTLVRKRVASLSQADDLTSLDADAQADAEALLSFWVEHRLTVIILLARAEGSRYEDFRDVFVQCLLAPVRKKLRAARPGRPLAPHAELVLLSVFDNTVRTLVRILEERDTGPEIRAAFRLFWSYQLAGLAGLVKELTP